MKFGRKSSFFHFHDSNDGDLFFASNHQTHIRFLPVKYLYSTAEMSSECRAGYICEQRNKALVDPINEYSCQRLKEVAIKQGFGDIFAGIYCPAGTIRDGGANIRNCPAGHYCEDPSLEPKKCSAGFYCPAKVRYYTAML